jgi:hypothetical protein
MRARSGPWAKTRTSAPGSATGRGFHSRVLKTLNREEVTPIPSPRQRIAETVKAGLLARRRAV